MTDERALATQAAEPAAGPQVVPIRRVHEPAGLRDAFRRLLGRERVEEAPLDEAEVTPFPPIAPAYLRLWAGAAMAVSPLPPTMVQS